MIDLEALSRQLPNRRWFGGKGERLERVELIDECVIDEARPTLVLAIVEVVFAGGDSHLYHLPLLVQEDGAARDAFDDVGRLQLIGELVGQGTTIKCSGGAVHFQGPGLDPLDPPGRDSIRAIGEDQTNTSLVLDEQVIVKMFRRVQVGTNPDLELTRVLTNAGFHNVPAHLGHIIYEGKIRGDESCIDLAIAQQFLTDVTSGWDRTLSQLHDLFTEAPVTDVPEDVRSSIEQRSRPLLASFQQLGEVTASLHLTLALDEMAASADLAPERLEQADLRASAESVQTSMRKLVEGGAGPLAELTGAINKRLDRFLAIQDGGQKTRVHGDYHLGQLLNTARGWVITDFEGEPARSLKERRAKHSPLKDVAGMLRSFNYAATSALFERTDPHSEDWHKLQIWADTWEDLARESFLSLYLTKVLTEGRFLPSERNDLNAMLLVFEIDKALYELDYEMRHRPDWVHIPLRGIARLMED